MKVGIQDIEVFINESSELAQERADGVDLWALWHNLKRTPAERIRRHDMAMGMIRKLRKAKKV